MKRKIVGIILLLVAIFAGTYIGVYFFFVRSILGIIKAFNSDIGDGIILFLYSLLKILFAFPLTEIISYELGYFGMLALGVIKKSN